MADGLTSRIAKAGYGWTALSLAEVSEAARVCSSCADTPAQAFQILAAYFAVASARSNADSNASISDSEAAQAVPRIRGRGCVSADQFRKSIRPTMEAWGLVRCSKHATSLRGRPPTSYEFPIVEKLFYREKESEELAEDDGPFTGFPQMDSPKNVLSTTPDVTGVVTNNYPGWHPG